MGVLWITELPNRESSLNSKGDQRTTRTFQVKTSDPADDQAVVMGYAGLPRIGAFYSSGSSSNIFLRVAEKNPRQVPNSRTLWEVTVTYDNTSPQDQDEEKDPTLRPPPDPSFSANRVTVVVERDAEDETLAIANSAGDPFDPPIEIEVARPVVRFTRFLPRNAKSQILSWIMDYVGTVNEDSFLGAAAKSVKLNDISADPEEEGEFKFYRVNFEFEYNRDGWQKKLLDQGYRKRPVGEEEDGFKAISNADGSPIASPALLDGAGDVLAEDADPEFITRDVYKSKPFSVFGLQV